MSLPLKTGWVPSTWVWGIWLTVVGLLVSVSVFSGMSLRQQLLDSAWQQADVAAKLVAMRIVSNVEHADDILLHTQETFNRLGPGLTAQDTLLKARPLSANSLGQVVILNAAGDPILAVPAGGDTPDYSALIAKTAEHAGNAPFSYTLSADPQGRLNRVLPLRFDDGTFAGAVLVKLPTMWLAENLSTIASAYGLTMQLRQGAQVVTEDQFWYASHAARDLEPQRSEQALAGTGLTVHVRLRRDAIAQRWHQSVDVLGLVVALSIAVLTVGSFWLQRTMIQRTRSRLRAEVARSEADLTSRFLANMSHELRTPMTGVLGAVELLQDTSPTPQQRSLLQLIERSGGHLMSILNDVLDVSRMEFNALRLDPQPTVLLGVLQDVTQMLMPRAHLQGIALYAQFDVPDAMRVQIDAFRFKQVLTNLLGNAVKFTPDGHVLVQAHLTRLADQTWLEVMVTDTGVGIASDQLVHLFKPFSQADLKTSRRFGGTGLGLAICKQLLGLMGGTIEVSSEPGRGSCFAFRLPLVEVLADAPSEGPQPVPPAPTLPEVWVYMDDALLRKGLLLHLKHLGVTVQPGLPMQAGGEAPPWVLLDEPTLSRLDPAVLRGCQVVCVGVRLDRRSLGGAPENGVLTLSEPVRREALLKILQSANGLAPVARADGAVPSPDAAVGAEAPAMDLRGLRVLVAEDNLITQKILQMFMDGMGCMPTFVTDGQQALDAVQSLAFDVVLMDCHMPGMDGYAATQAIREWEAQLSPPRRLPIVALTAATMASDIELCMNAGMDEVCSKPVERQKLKARLHHWAQQNR